MIESCKFLGDIALKNSDGSSGIIQQKVETVPLDKKGVSRKLMNMVFDLKKNKISLVFRDIKENDVYFFNFVGNTSAPKAPLWRFANKGRTYLFDIGSMMVNFRKKCESYGDSRNINSLIDDVLTTFFKDETLSSGEHNDSKIIPIKILNTNLLDFDIGLNNISVPSFLLRKSGDKKVWVESFQKSFIKPLLAIKGIKDEDIALNVATIISKEGEEVCLSRTNIYKEVLLNELFGLDKKINLDVDCNICGKRGCINDFSLKYAIFQRTKRNWAYNLSKDDYNNKFTLCPECYKAVSVGETILGEKYSLNIGYNTVFVAPRFIEGSQDVDEYVIDRLNSFRKNIYTQDMFIDYIRDVNDNAVDIYSLKNNFFLDIHFYEEANAATKIKQSIYNVDANYLISVFNELKEYNPFFKKYRFNNLNSIYYIYQVSTAKGDKLKASNSCKRDFSMILNRIPLKRSMILRDAYASVARAFYETPSKDKDYVVNQKVHVLNFYINKLEELGLLEKKDTKKIDENLLTGLNEEDADFIVKNKLTELETGLYLLGTLVNEIAYVQNKTSSNKAILNSLNMRGMNCNDVDRLIAKITLKMNELSKKDDGRFLYCKNNTIKFALAQELILKCKKENMFVKYTKEEVLNSLYMGYLQASKRAIIKSKKMEEVLDEEN